MTDRTTSPPSPDTSREAPSGWGPTVTGGRDRRRWWRRAAIALAILLVLVLVDGLGAAFYANSRITKVSVDGLEGGTGPLHVLVVGSDSRAGLTEDQQREFTTGGDVGERTDTIFVLTIDNGRAAILAFPRDLYVQRCDGSTGRINAAIGIGGPSCMVRTVSALSGIPIDHYVAVSFVGFVGIVDAVGGVEVCIDKAIQDPYSGADFQPGCQRLDGRQALAYARVRKIDSDLERIKRQQKFLAALADELTSPATAVNPVRTWRTAGRIGGSLTADDGLGVFDLLRLAWGGRAIAGGALATHTVPATPRTIGGAAVLVPNEQEAEQLYARFRSGSILDEASGGPAPSDITVSVLNGAGIEGAAGRTADGLRTAGFRIGEVGNADLRDRTTVLHPPGQQPAAQVVADQLPVDATIAEDPSVSTITLILGRDLAG